ncbi:MAG: hypothetical protein ABI315_04165 [Bacteroidia bacterium]
MKEINEYLKTKFEKLPLSHKNYTVGAQIDGVKAPQPVGNKLHSKYLILYIDFNSFYKPITNYL